ncbi:unnamed protein product [Caenorhabditis bovis]|uniref:Uncharacterized protein n=1 Tax=Caenorhabditis bovis TaxID=2654633 RepID=A0A8S1E6V6_9PELO|nr:unnamed protein product [Caenorhabditis bovis]
MSLDATLINLNETLSQVANLLKAIELAVIMIAVTLALTLIGCTGIFYYAKYKKYHPLREETSPNVSTYKQSKYDPVEV